MTTESDLLAKTILKKVNLNDFPKDFHHYFCTWHSGFFGSFYNNSCIKEHQDKLRSFHGAMLALDIVESDFFINAPSTYGVVVNCANKDGTQNIKLADELDSDLQYFSNNFETSYHYYEGSNYADALDDNGDTVRKQIDYDPLDEDSAERRDNALASLRKVFSKGDHSRRLNTSALWLFRSFVSQKSLDILLESTISLEVLLGDREAAANIGLTRLLANRCAYLLGQTAKHRTALLDSFKSIYEIRSEIVHSGLHQGDRKAESAASSARELAGKVLRREIELGSS